jgi:hypothetical protein
LLQLPQRLAEFLLARKKADRLVDGELQYVINAFAIHTNVEHRGLESLAAAVVARNEHVGHEHHLDLEVAGAFTGLTSATGDIEAERPRGVASLARERCVGEDPSDLIERLHVRHWIRTR